MVTGRSSWESKGFNGLDLSQARPDRVYRPVGVRWRKSVTFGDRISVRTFDEGGRMGRWWRWALRFLGNLTL